LVARMQTIMLRASTGGSLAFALKSPKLSFMTKETRLRVIIVLALAVGYVVVAILRSGTAW